MNVMMGLVSSRRRLVLQSVIKVLHTTTVINLFLQHQLNKTVFYFDYQIRLRLFSTEQFSIYITE